MKKVLIDFRPRLLVIPQSGAIQEDGSAPFCMKWLRLISTLMDIVKKCTGISIIGDGIV